MNTKLLLVPITVLFLGASAASAAAAGTSNADPNGQESTYEHGSSMMGMGRMNGNMMGGCSMMGADAHMDPKTVMQMHAEMMRAMSDIMLKYSNKLETSPSK